MSRAPVSSVVCVVHGSIMHISASRATVAACIMHLSVRTATVTARIIHQCASALVSSGLRMGASHTTHLQKTNSTVPTHSTQITSHSHSGLKMLLHSYYLHLSSLSRCTHRGTDLLKNVPQTFVHSALGFAQRKAHPNPRGVMYLMLLNLRGVLYLVSSGSMRLPLLICPQPIRRQCLSTRRDSAIFSPTCHRTFRG